MSETTSLPPRPVVLAAGGTGGHLFPALALAETLVARGVPVLLVTDRRGLSFGGGLTGPEASRLFTVHHVQAAGRKPGLLGILRMLVKQGLGYLQAHALLLRHRPAVIVGFGGYPSLPTVMAGLHQGRPLVLHEQNAVPGRVNRLLARKARVLATAFVRLDRLPAGAAPLHQTGNPVRAEIARLHDLPYLPPTDDEPLRLLVIGGSQGATIFSEILPAAIALLPTHLSQRLDVTQQARPADIEEARFAYARINQRVELKTFFDDMPQRLATAHLVISRAGASSVAELAAAGRPAILVPYPHATDNHQHANAAQMADQGAAWLMPQDGFTAEALAARLESLLTHPARLAEIAAGARATAHIDAADRLADLVLAQAGQSKQATARPHNDQASDTAAADERPKTMPLRVAS